MAVRKLVERTYIDSDWTGESTDTKPTENVGLNNLFLELDTGDFYYLESLGGITEEVVWQGTLFQDSPK